MGPTGQACNVYWKLKKSCSNSGKYNIFYFSSMKLICIGPLTGHRCPTVKEEPRSPAQAKKRKANSVSDTSSIGHANVTGFNIKAAEPNRKCQKMASGGSSQV
jgi:hypothetical protein